MQPLKQFSNVQVVEHPLVQDKLSHIRSLNTEPYLFRQLMEEIGYMMGYELTRNLPTQPQKVKTPIGVAPSSLIRPENIAIIPILRAGLGMSAGVSKLIPRASIGHLGFYRDHTTNHPVEYLSHLPKINGHMIIIVDPMLATGNTACKAVSALKDKNIKGEQMIFLGLVAAPEGLETFCGSHPEINVVVAAIDSHLDKNAFVVPGLGDAGDRMFDT
ncbi:MAG: uracil phosphoribosyltransferase [Rhodospirillaceae bacterium TMED8]|nr:uracil phosphoribosyltransferase [Magnetovibrio sp.]OUT51713.1 MAG: uracil phosphoribosyltransferase [Rhodospirillaceae bacterium TMED8]|tara:strand:+ start:181 stop:828 length:648 start_codon:yes stop_codon:yes gene_type:complete